MVSLTDGNNNLPEDTDGSSDEAGSTDDNDC